MAKRDIFGTDGIRGVANTWPMDSDLALRAGRAIARHFSQEPRQHKIVIGKDTRLSGYMIETALASGLVAAGVDVYLVGPLPTPGIAFITTSMRADAGVVISASHNSYEYNGIKVFNRRGYKLSDEVEAELEACIGSQDLQTDSLVAPDKIGKAFRIDDAVGRYVVFLKSTFPKELTLEGMKVVIDCANGATYKVAPEVFEELGADVFPVGVSPNGMNINRGVGSTNPELARQRVLEVGADLGITLDGDGDRVVLIDEKGAVIDGDAVLAFVGRHLLGRGQLGNKTLVATITSNIGLDRAIQEVGGRIERTQVGDRYVAQKMQEVGSNFGGESSGHLIFFDTSTTGDGTLAALQVLRVMMESNRPLSELAAQMTPVPQIARNVPVRVRTPRQNMPKFDQELSAIENELKGQGRVLFRYSGTENLARILIEGEDKDRLSELANQLEATLLTEMEVSS